jgi:hypothetical protein
MQTKNQKLDVDAASLCNGKVMLKKQDKNSTQIEELIGPGVPWGIPKLMVLPVT